MVCHSYSTDMCRSSSTCLWSSYMVCHLCSAVIHHLCWRYADPVWDLHFIFSGRCHWSSAWSHLWVPQASNTAAAYQNTAFGNIFYETSGSLLPGGVLLTIPHIRALKLAFDTTNYWNPHILILVGALPNHRRDQHSIFSKRKGLTSLSYFKYTVGYF